MDTTNTMITMDSFSELVVTIVAIVLAVATCGGQ
jgi:hypothetical protein